MSTKTWEFQFGKGEIRFHFCADVNHEHKLQSGTLQSIWNVSKPARNSTLRKTRPEEIAFRPKSLHQNPSENVNLRLNNTVKYQLFFTIQNNQHWWWEKNKNNIRSQKQFRKKNQFLREIKPTKPPKVGRSEQLELLVNEFTDNFSILSIASPPRSVGFLTHGGRLICFLCHSSEIFQFNFPVFSKFSDNRKR